MDILCTNCGEPWDIFHVKQDSPQDFKMKGSVILKCPSCPKDGSKPNLDEKTKMNLEAAAVLGEILGDDIDGYAAELEDFGLV
jgi:hypothetical protein